MPEGVGGCCVKACNSTELDLAARGDGTETGLGENKAGPTTSRFCSLIEDASRGERKSTPVEVGFGNQVQVQIVSELHGRADRYWLSLGG